MFLFLLALISSYVEQDSLWVLGSYTVIAHRLGPTCVRPGTRTRTQVCAPQHAHPVCAPGSDIIGCGYRYGPAAPGDRLVYSRRTDGATAMSFSWSPKDNKSCNTPVAAGLKRSRNDTGNKVTVVLGAQWGDEGKGKVVDLLATEADLVCRCQVTMH